jgi:hypothetical protein
MVPWAALAAARLLRRVAPGDVVWTCSPPESAALPGWLATVRGARWWADFADGWCQQGLRREAIRPGLRRSLELFLERRCVASADSVSTVNDAIVGWLRALRPGGDVRLFPNIVPHELEAVPRPGRGRPAHPQPVLGYLGRLSLSDPERSLRPLVDALAFSPRQPPLRFVFRGEFSARDLEEIGSLRALGHVVDVSGPLPREALAGLRRELDGLVVVLSPDQLGSSSKLLDALGLDLPVLTLARRDSLAARIVAEARCGEVAPVSDPAEGARVLASFLEKLGKGTYQVDPAMARRYTASTWVPGLVDALAALGGERTVPRT